MKKSIEKILLPLIALLVLVQCETPGNPDFTLSNKIDTPLIAKSQFQFLGDNKAMIDTTSEDLDELFAVDGDNFITLSKEEDFDFGDLDDAMPEVDTEPTTLESEVGEIELGNFASENEEGNLGEADFEDLTGQPSTFQEGDEIPGGQSPSPVNIELDTDFFASAMIKRGGIQISLRNELGFDIDQLTMVVKSGSNELETILISNFEHPTTQTETVDLIENPGTDPEMELADLNVDVEIEWSTQNMQGQPGSLIINDVKGDNLYASEVEASISSQEFKSDGLSEFSDEEFLFSDPSHYIELENGDLLIDEIINSIDVDIESLEISFPELRTPPYSEADSLVILFTDGEKIPRNNTTPISLSHDLTDVRIYAENNEVNYNIFAITEDTQQGNGSGFRKIKETDKLTASISLQNLEIREAFGIAVNKQIVLGDDDPDNGEGTDLRNDTEAEVIEIDGMDDLSSKVDGIEFTNSSLSIHYNTNVEIPLTVIGAFLGVDANGNEFFLQGKPGTDQEVTSSDPTSQLLFGGSQISNDKLIKFEIDSESTNQTLSTTFDRTNSNVADFFNNLPTSIRFIGIANLNDSGDAGTIRNPIRFDPSITVDIPLALRADKASFTETTKADLKGLPGPDDNSLLEEGSIRIQYLNRIPLGIELELGLMNEQGDLLTTVPLIEEAGIQFQSAKIGTNGFSETPAENVAVLTLNRSQLDQINQTRSIKIMAGLSSAGTGEVKIRNTDDVQMTISGKFEIRNTID